MSKRLLLTKANSSSVSTTNARTRFPLGILVSPASSHSPRVRTPDLLLELPGRDRPGVLGRRVVLPPGAIDHAPWSLCAQYGPAMCTRKISSPCADRRTGTRPAPNGTSVDRLGHGHAGVVGQLVLDAGLGLQRNLLRKNDRTKATSITGTAIRNVWSIEFANDNSTPSRIGPGDPRCHRWRRSHFDQPR